ncbi:hypothetical protein AMTRI_Chr02g263840 [Amborella trichopoda]
MSSSPTSQAEKKPWWLSNKKVAEKHLKDARVLLSSQDPTDISTALNLLDAALSLYPKWELAMELKARTLLYLRRFKDIAIMLQDDIPSFKYSENQESETSQSLSREKVKLLSETNPSHYSENPAFKCFSISDLKKKVLSGLYKRCAKEQEWRYTILGQALFHLGLMEDAMVLLQAGKRVASANFRRESGNISDDKFSAENFPSIELEPSTQMLCNIKLLLRRKAAGLAALEAGLYSEAIRHFSKIVDGRRGTPSQFATECYMHRATAYRLAGRIPDSLADCNRALALEPTSIGALATRAELFESVRCMTESVQDLEHLKLLYDSVLRGDRKPWRTARTFGIRDVSSRAKALGLKLCEMKGHVDYRENVDYHALVGVRRGCTRSEVERAHLVLCLRHRPDRAAQFVDRLELSDERDAETVRDQSRMSALLLFRLLQKAYSAVMASVMDEEAAERQRKRAMAAAVQPILQPVQAVQEPVRDPVDTGGRFTGVKPENVVFSGAFCRDLAAVGGLLSRCHMAVTYEAMSC